MKKEDKNLLRIRVLLEFQRALLDMVTPNLRGVTVGWEDRKISAIFFYDGEIGDEEHDIVSTVETEVIAGFPEHNCDFKAKRLDYPEKTESLSMEAWVYYRME